MMYYNGYYPSMFGFWPFGFVFQIFLAILVIFLIIAIIRRVSSRHSHGHWREFLGDRSKEILKERYAKGELTKEQFESMKKDLEQ